MHRSVHRSRWLVWPASATVMLLASVPLLAAEGGEGGMAAEVMRLFKTSGWGVLAFVIVLVILWKKLFPPIIEALDRRERTIRESLEAAERAREEAQRMMAEHEDHLEKARSEARAIIDEGKADAERVKNSIVESARRESEEISARARRDIELAKKAAVDDLYRQAARLSFDIAEKVIQKSLDPKEHEGIVDACIKDYKKEVKAS